MLLDFTNIARSNIPISMAAPTHDVSIFNTHFLYSFPNFFFSNIFLRNFLGPQGLKPPIFEFPFFRYIPIYFFRGSLGPKSKTDGTWPHTTLINTAMDNFFSQNKKSFPLAQFSNTPALS